MGLFSSSSRASRAEDRAAKAARQQKYDRAIAQDRKSNAIRAKAAAKKSK